MITAEAQFPCLLTSIQRHVFLDFLMRYPVAGQNVMLELSSEYSRTALQLRTLGLIITAPARLVRLLLDWSKEGERTKNGARIQCSLTQTEIGEHIGVSRETITRTLKDFENQGLIERRGSTLIVPNIAALESCEYAI